MGLRAGLRGALGRISPGADTYLLGAVPIGVVASIYGAHLLRRATRELQADGRGGSARTSRKPVIASEAKAISRLPWSPVEEIAASRSSQ